MQEDKHTCMDLLVEATQVFLLALVPDVSFKSLCPPSLTDFLDSHLIIAQSRSQLRHRQSTFTKCEIPVHSGDERYATKDLRAACTCST